MSINHSHPNIQIDGDGVHSSFGSMFQLLHDAGDFIHTTTLQRGKTYIVVYLHSELLKKMLHMYPLCNTQNCKKWGIAIL